MAPGHYDYDTFGPEDEMEKWSPDQWERFFRLANRTVADQDFKAIFASDAAYFEAAGIQVDSHPNGIVLNRRIVISRSARRWSKVGKTREQWYSYSDPAQIVDLVKDGVWKQTEQGVKAAERRSKKQEVEKSKEKARKEKRQAERKTKAEHERKVIEQRRVRLAAKRAAASERRVQQGVFVANA